MTLLAIQLGEKNKQLCKGQNSELRLRAAPAPLQTEHFRLDHNTIIESTERAQ
ncbi:unnamed protein product [Albugo candida]|uniref:Uncharacterized protein n=1 Tax=Albugo candida TaxID=65357 RepID=A0A024GFT3_9STRA|nr:unnamed protein product [Albugo candida]|eukprot:CCI45552.1 unnamed protein product [Albugo candida]